jgi:hypothetical protein
MISPSLEFASWSARLMNSGGELISPRDGFIGPPPQPTGPPAELAGKTAINAGHPGFEGDFGIAEPVTCR